MARTIAKDHDKKRGAILKTAARFFAENGYDRSSMNQLAVKCGVSKALIYHYYESKEMMLFDILNSHLIGLLKTIDSVALTKSDHEHDLQLLVSALLDSYRGADHEHRLQLEAMGALTREQQSILSNIQRSIVRKFSNVIHRVKPALFEQREADLFAITMSLFGMLNWFYLWHQPGKGISREDYATLASNLLLGGVAGLTNQSADVRQHDPGPFKPR